MKPAVILSPEAAEDLRDIRAWLEQAGAGDAAARTLRAIVDGMQTLAAFPAIGREGTVAGTREYIVRRHRIVYRNGEDEIRVLAIFGPGQSGYEPPQADRV